MKFIAEEASEHDPDKTGTNADIKTELWMSAVVTTVWCHTTYCSSSVGVDVRWPSVPDFLRQSLVLTPCPGKNRSSPVMPICPIFGLVSRICPDLPIPAAVCLRIGGQKLAQILSVCTKNRWPPLGEIMTLPQTPKLDARRLTPGALAPYSVCPGLRCPNYGHLMWTWSFIFRMAVSLWQILKVLHKSVRVMKKL